MFESLHGLIEKINASVTRTQLQKKEPHNCFSIDSIYYRNATAKVMQTHKRSLKLGLLLSVRITLANRFNTVLVEGILLCVCVASA